MQHRGNCSKAVRALRLHLTHNSHYVRCSQRHLAAARLPSRCRHFCSGRGRGGIAETDASCLRNGQRCACALADQSGLQLGNRRHLGQHELTNRPSWQHRQVTEHNASLAAALDHGQQKTRVACEPVQFGDDQYSLAGTAGSQRGGGLRPIGALAALHLVKLRHYVTTGLGDVRRYGLALHLEAKPGSALAISRNPEIADETGAGRGGGTAEA